LTSCRRNGAQPPDGTHHFALPSEINDLVASSDPQREVRAVSEPKASAKVRIMEAMLCMAGTAFWLLISWVVLAVVGWGVADSGRPLTWAEWGFIMILFTIPPAALGLLATTSWTGRRPGHLQLRVAVALAIACAGYAVWWLVQVR
jgi:hypothetical protein